jgi:hypothetical protein
MILPKIQPVKPSKKRTDYMFYYSDRYRSGSFDVRDVSRWESTGHDYYRGYCLHFKDGTTVSLIPDEFYRFQTFFDKLEDNVFKG